jgi:hypothetical protein
MKATLNKNACSGDAPFVSDFAKRNVRITAWMFRTALALTTGALPYLSFNALINGTWAKPFINGEGSSRWTRRDIRLSLSSRRDIRTSSEPL